MAEIPNKLYFRIGEVSKLINVEPYVLRYWESEFPDIKPSKSKSGQRLYKRRDVEMLVKIKELLYDERYTINGARKRLKDCMRTGDEIEVRVPETELPESQLDVFATPEPIIEEELVSMHGEKQPQHSAKTLHKVRRDLEELLAIIRS